VPCEIAASANGTRSACDLVTAHRPAAQRAFDSNSFILPCRAVRHQPGLPTRAPSAEPTKRQATLRCLRAPPDRCLSARPARFFPRRTILAQLFITFRPGLKKCMPINVLSTFFVTFAIFIDVEDRRCLLARTAGTGCLAYLMRASRTLSS